MTENTPPDFLYNPPEAKEVILEPSPSVFYSEWKRVTYKWECEVFGMGYGIVVRRQKAPFFFWRWMQWLCFGNRWRKLPKPVENLEPQ